MDRVGLHGLGGVEDRFHLQIRIRLTNLNGNYVKYSAEEAMPGCLEEDRQ